MAYISDSSDDEDLKKKNAQSIGGEAEANPGSGGPSVGAAAQPYTQTGFASAKNIFEKNKGAGDAYDVTQPFQEDLDKGKSDLSSSFSKLQSSIGSQVSGQKAGDNDLAEAIAQGSASGGFKKIMGAINPATVSGTMDPVNTRYSANDVASLNTAPGIQAAIANQAQKKGVQNYTQGMGSLDAAIYQNNPQTRIKSNALANQYAEYDKQKQDYAKQSADAIASSNKELQDSAASLREKLSSQSAQLQADYGRGGSKYVSASDAPVKAQAEAEKQQYIASTAASLPEPYRSEFLSKAGKIKSDLAVKSDGKGGNYEYSNEGANQFNNIMALLGQGNRVNASSGGNNYSLDKSGLDKQIDFYADQARKAAANSSSIQAANAKAAAAAPKPIPKPMPGASKQEIEAYNLQEYNKNYGGRK